MSTSISTCMCTHVLRHPYTQALVNICLYMRMYRPILRHKNINTYKRTTVAVDLIWASSFLKELNTDYSPSCSERICQPGLCLVIECMWEEIKKTHVLSGHMGRILAVWPSVSVMSMPGVNLVYSKEFYWALTPHDRQYPWAVWRLNSFRNVGKIEVSLSPIVLSRLKWTNWTTKTSLFCQ